MIAVGPGYVGRGKSWSVHARSYSQNYSFHLGRLLNLHLKKCITIAEPFHQAAHSIGCTVVVSHSQITQSWEETLSLGWLEHT